MSDTFNLDLIPDRNPDFALWSGYPDSFLEAYLRVGKDLVLMSRIRVVLWQRYMVANDLL